MGVCLVASMDGLREKTERTLTAAHAPRTFGLWCAGARSKRAALPPVCPTPRQGGSDRAPFSPGRPRDRPRRHSWAGAAGVGDTGKSMFDTGKSMYAPLHVTVYVCVCVCARAARCVGVSSSVLVLVQV